MTTSWQRTFSHEPRTASGKKLLTATDLLKINGVGAPRISPDGLRVLYTVGETRMEKDKEWKGVTQVWVVPAGGGKARQYTRGEKNSSAPEWSPDGNMSRVSQRSRKGRRAASLDDDWLTAARPGW
jgi:Tol biopolymer transport system component